jgi:hypothetical protein
MSRTDEQMTAAKELAAAAPGYRVIPDAEGWPICRGPNGRLEHLGAGQIAAFTRGPHTFRRLLALPGVRRHQTGDNEYRVLLSVEAVPAVAALLRCHRRRGAPANPFKARHGVGISAEEPTGPHEVSPHPSQAAGIAAGQGKPPTSRDMTLRTEESR